MRTLVTGATGFIGRRVIRSLSHPIVLTRDPRHAAQILGLAVEQTIAWDPMTGPPPPQAFDNVDRVIHLAGESIAGRWTRTKRQKIHDSRVLGTRNLVATLTGLTHPPRLLISISAIGYYGHRGDDELDESSPPGEDFLACLCRDWESEALKARDADIRVVNPRLGVVIGPDGGFLSRMLPPFRYGFGARLADGRQWMSWVHIDDVAAVFEFITQNSELAGPVNTVSPHPVTNAQFTQTLAHVLRRPAPWRIPRFVLTLALGQAASALLASQRAVPRRLETFGFAFQFPRLIDALRSLAET